MQIRKLVTCSRISSWRPNHEIRDKLSEIEKQDSKREKTKGITVDRGGEGKSNSIEWNLIAR